MKTQLVSNSGIKIRLFSAIKYSAVALCLLFVLLAASTADAQAFIRFSLTQGRITVPVNSTNSSTITNAVNLSGGATNANFDVSGLPPGAGYSLTDTNGNPLPSTTTDTNLWLIVNTTNIPEGIYNFRLNAGGFDTNGLPVTNSIIFVLQSAHIWNGSLDVSNSWSDPSSWLGGVPTATSDVVFGDQGAQTNSFSDSSGLPFTNSIVDNNMTIASLRFAQTGQTNFVATNPPPIFHHVHLLANKTLTISGTNGFSIMRDYFDDAVAALNTAYVAISGEAGSKVIVSNQTANVALFVNNIGTTVSTLNMSNLNTLAISVNRIGIGDYQLYPNYRDLNNALNVGRDTNGYSARPRQMTANVYLAKTNVITASYVDPQNYTNELSRGYAFTLYNNEQNGVGSSIPQSFLLGISNIFLVDGICFYGANGNGTTQFGVSNGVALFRNTDGISRMSVFTVSDDGGTNEATSNIKGTVDFSAGTVDILADRLYLARDREYIATNNGTPNIQATLTIGKGSVNVNTAILGFQEHTKPDADLLGDNQPYLNYCRGTLSVTNGGTMTVNGNLILGYTADTNNSSDAEQYNTYGQINIFSNSTVRASTLIVDGGLNYYDANLRNNTITINTGGNLIVTNSIGGNNYTGSTYPTFANTGGLGLPVDTLTMGSSGILTVFLSSGKTNIYVRNFVSTGLTPGIIKIASLPAGLGFPATLPIIHYQSAAPVLAADMSAVAASYPGVQGYILNDADGQNIELFLTTNAPNTLVWTGNQNNKWDLTSKNWVTMGGGIVTNFAMGDIVNFDDTSSVTNIDIVEVVVPNQSTNGVVITNSAYGYVFNAVGGGQIAGTAKIIKQGTNILTFNAPEAGPIFVNAGEVDVLSSGSLGNTTLSSNTVLNVDSGGALGSGLNSTVSTVTVANGASINGAIVINGGSLVNNGTITVPTGSQLMQSNNAVITNNAIMNFGNSNPAWDALAGTTVANFGTILVTQGRIIPRGFWFGTGTIFDPVTSAPQASTLARFNLKADPNAMLSVGPTPSGSIGDMFVQGRFDLSDAANNNNAGGKFLVEVDTVNHVNDTVTATRWNNLGGCYWVMTNLTGAFQSGQSFDVLVNAAGAGVSNFVDTITLYPTVVPTVPGPGLEWNLTGLQNYGTIAVTNSTMVWDGVSSTSWDTNGVNASWKSGFFDNNLGAVFDDSAAGSTTVTLNTTVAPSGFNTLTVTNTDHSTFTNIVTTISMPDFMPGIVVSNANKDYTISGNGKISGMTGIYKTGPGTLTLLTSNDFSGGLTIDGGTFEMTNTSAIGPNINQIYNQVLMDNNATVKFSGNINQNFNHFITINQGGGTFEVSSSTNILTLDRNVLGSGNLTKTGIGTLALTQTGDIYTGDTIANQGTLRLTASAAGFGDIVLNNSATLELNAANLKITNAIDIEGPGTIVNILGNVTNTSSGPWNGAGNVTVTTTNTADLFAFTGSLTNFSGTLSFGTSSNAFQFNNSTNSNNSIGSATATFDLGMGAATLDNFNGAGLTYNLGALSGGPNTTLSGRTSNNVAAVASTTYSIGGNGNSTIFSGKITDGVGLDTVSVVKVGTGSLLLNGNSTYTGSTIVNNGVFGGSGSINGPLTVLPGATLSPGSPVGTFTVNNNVILNGAILMELDQSSFAKHDELAVTGTITASGSLVVTNVGPDLSNGSTFKLFSQGVTGLSVTLPASNPSHTSSYVWNNNITADGTIQLISGGSTNSINPNPTNIVAAVSGNTLTLTWPMDYTGWTLQAQTNSLAIGISSNWVNISGSSSTNKVSVAIDPNNGVVFYRLIYQP